MKYDQKNAFSNRRDFLKLMSKAGLSLPLARATILGAGIFAGREVVAATTSVKRVVFIYVPQGSPSGASVSFVPKTSASGLVMNTCSAPFETLKNECIFFSGTGVMKGAEVFGGHAETHRVLGGYNAPSTLDVELEKTIGASSPIKALRLGVLTGQKDPISSINRTALAAYQDNPSAAYASSFGGSLDISSEDVQRRRKEYMINRDALAKIKAKLGVTEIQRLEENEAAVAQLQRDLESSVTPLPGCTNPAWNTDNFTGPYTEAEFTRIFDLQVDNAVLALKCNLTKVVSIQLGSQQGEFTVTGIPSGSLHGAVHSHSFDGFAVYRTYFSQRVATLIQRLKNAKDENNNSLLDSTLVLQVTDMGDADAHLGSDAPFMMAGGGAGINRGKIISVAKHTQLLDTVAQAFGVYGTIPSYSVEGPASGILL